MNSEAVSAGEWWRIFTAITLHSDASHLAANVSTGFLLLGLAMANYGPGIGLAAAYLAGAGGNFSGFFVYGKMHRSLGASGMVMGALGLLAAQTISLARKNPAARKYVASGLRRSDAASTASGERWARRALGEARIAGP